MSGEEPVRLVVKNTFIDVDPTEGNGELEMDRHASAPAMYGKQWTAGSEQGNQNDAARNARIAEAGVGVPGHQGRSTNDGTFIDDVIPRGGKSPKKVPVAAQPKRVRQKGPAGADSDDSFGEDDREEEAIKVQAKSGQKGQTFPSGAGRNRGKGSAYGRRGGGAKGSGGASYDYFQDGYSGNHRSSRTSNQNSGNDFLAMTPTGSMFPPGHLGFPGVDPQTSSTFGMLPGQMYQPPWGMMPPPYMPMPGWGPMAFQPPPGYSMNMGGMPLGMMQEGAKGANGHTRTTVMLRNLPPEYTRDMVIKLLNTEGFERLYDFVYMPMNLRTMASFGYVFVNLVSPVVADQCRSVFQGLNRWEVKSDKVCDVLWSAEQQGLSANIERYRNSPVMHEIVPEECKPVVLANGVRVPFPAPTKRLREPRIRRPQAGGDTGAEAGEEEAAPPGTE